MKRALLISLFLGAVLLLATLGILSPSLQAEGPNLRKSDVTPGSPGLSFREAEIFGVTREAYTTTTAYLNAPAGLFIDNEDSLYVV